MKSQPTTKQTRTSEILEDSRPLPESWGRLGSECSLTPEEKGGVTHYAVEVTIKHLLHATPKGRNEIDFSEGLNLVVRYVTADGKHAFAKSFEGSIISDGNNTTVVPRSVFRGQPSNFISKYIVQPDRLNSAPTHPDDPERVKSIYDI